MTEQIFTGLSIIIGMVIIALGIMKFFKQPLMIGYIIAGILISLLFPGLLHDNISFETFSKIGISLLLFMVGLELNPRIIKDMGKSSLWIGVAQVVITAIIGWTISRCIGFDTITSLYLAIGFAFSSTIVVLKLFSDKEETETEHARLSIGVLIVQDIMVLILFLVIASTNTTQSSGLITAVTIMLKLIGVIIGFWAITKYVIPPITKKIAESQEYLFIFSIGRCFVLGTLFEYLGFGMEIGTLLAGITLANSNYRFEIMSRVKSLRDFFIVMFFVLLGAQINFHIGRKQIGQVGILSLFILFIKPLITTIIAGLMKHTKKVSFLTGMSLGQISEFSFLLVSMGITYGHIKDPSVLSLVTMLGLISIAGSSYFIMYGEKIYEKWKIWKWILSLFSFGTVKWYHEKNKEFDTMLVGYGRFGSQLYETLHEHKKILVIDQDPEVIAKIEKKGIPCVYGDIGDTEFIKELGIKGMKMIISTIPNYDDNMILIKTIKAIDKEIITILVCNHVQESIQLYEAGADYVIVPHYIGAFHTSMLLEDYGFDVKKFIQNRESQIHKLKDTHKDMMVEILKK